MPANDESSVPSPVELTIKCQKCGREIQAPAGATPRTTFTCRDCSAPRRNRKMSWHKPRGLSASKAGFSFGLDPNELAKDPRIDWLNYDKRRHDVTMLIRWLANTSAYLEGDEREAMRMRAGGASLREVAEKLGVSHMQASRVIRATVQKLKEEVAHIHGKTSKWLGILEDWQREDVSDDRRKAGKTSAKPGLAKLEGHSDGHLVHLASDREETL